MDEKYCVPGPRNPCGPWTVRDRLGGQVTLLPPDDPRGVEVITQIGYGAGRDIGRRTTTVMRDGLFSYRQLGRMGVITSIINEKYMRPSYPKRRITKKDNEKHSSNIKEAYEAYRSRYKKAYPDYDSNTDFNNAYQRHLNMTKGNDTRPGYNEDDIYERGRALRIEQNEDQGNYIYFRPPPRYDEKIKDYPTLTERIFHQYQKAYKEDPTAESTQVVVIKVDPEKTDLYDQERRQELPFDEPPSENHYMFYLRQLLIKSRERLQDVLKRGGERYGTGEILLLTPNLGPEWFVNKHPLVIDKEAQAEYYRAEREKTRIKMEKVMKEEAEKQARKKEEKKQKANVANKTVKKHNSKRSNGNNMNASNNGNNGNSVRSVNTWDNMNNRSNLEGGYHRKKTPKKRKGVRGL
jgi:hypothetical protein